ncbi:hypothetical protein BC830DRAFT_144910 [Chytriomyces sp. MP71]|nr:hypothetical protein BC830DRAFT_144910 [Chytriomyces sp. MP71]
MIEEFQQVQEFLKKQIAQQTQQLRDAEIKYINREPREVDVTRIAELEEDIRRRKRKAHALMEELEYCKLELSNREANFNKIFNKNPLVGVMQPIGTLKEKKSPPKKSNSMSKLPPLPLYSPTMTPLPNALQTASFGRMAPHAAQSESN